MNERTIEATSLGTPDRLSRAFSKGRTCNQPGCGTRLSMYNQGRFCSLHEPRATPRTRGRKVA